MQVESDSADAGALVSALNRVAAIAEDEAQAQAQLAATARAAVEEGEFGRLGPGYHKRVRAVLDLLAGSTERMIGGAAELRRAWAAQLAAQGLSMREIAVRLGVTRQRVSVLLSSNAAAAADRRR